MQMIGNHGIAALEASHKFALKYSPYQDHRSVGHCTPWDRDVRKWEDDLTLIRAKGNTWNFLKVSHFVNERFET